MEKYQQSTQSSSQVITKESHLQVKSWPKESYNSQDLLIHLDRRTHGQRYIDQNFIYDIIIMFSKVNKYGGLTGAPWTFHMSTTYLYTNWVQWNKNHRWTLPDPSKITNKQPMSATKMQIFSKKDQLKQNIYCYTRL